MKTSIMSAAAVLTLMATESCFAQQWSPEWLVWLSSGCGGVSVGNGYIVTAEHCQTQNGDTAKFPDGQSYPLTVIREPGKNGNDEITLLLCNSPNVPHASIAPNAPRKGDKLNAYGFPDGKYHSSPGTVSVSGDDYILTEDVTNVIPGMSGGALVNEKGELVGICSGYGGSAKISEHIEAVGNLKVQRWISHKELMAAIKYAKGIQHPSKRRLIMFSMTGCSACMQYESEINKTGADVIVVKKNSTHYAEWMNSYKNHVGREVDQFPTFWVEGTRHTRTEGYQPGLLPTIVGWFTGIVKSITEGIFGPAPPAPNPTPVPAPNPEPKKYEREKEAPNPPQEPLEPIKIESPPVPVEPKAEAEIDWDKVSIVVVASNEIPEVAKFAEAPAKRAVNNLTKGKAKILVVSERTNPDKYAELDSIVQRGGKIFILVMIPQKDLPLGVMNAAAAQIEKMVINQITSSGLYDKVKNVPVEVVLERTDYDFYNQVLEISSRANEEREEIESNSSSKGILDYVILTLLSFLGVERASKLYRIRSAAKAMKFLKDKLPKR